MKDFAGMHGFNLEYAAPKAHKQNGVAEKFIDILRGGTNATLQRAQLGPNYWPLALDDQVWAQNRTVNKHNSTKTPFELWEGYPPNLSSARTFGCMALYYVPRESRLKHEPRAKWGIYVGNSKTSKAWQFATDQGSRVHIELATAAYFFEHMTHEDYSNLQTSNSSMLLQLFKEAQADIEGDSPEPSAESSDAAEGFNFDDELDEPAQEDAPVEDVDAPPEDLSSPERPAQPPAKKQAIIGPLVPAQEGSTPLTGLQVLGLTAEAVSRNENKENLSAKQDAGDAELPDVVEYDTNGEDESHHCKSTDPLCVLSSNNEQALAVFLTGRLHGLVASANRHQLPPEPKTMEEALNGPHTEQWKKAIQKEYDALVDRNTWELQELPPGRRAIGVKWVMKIKTTATGELEKFKARLVAKGYSQVKGIDHNVRPREFASPRFAH
jgi:hypothetical protein